MKKIYTVLLTACLLTASSAQAGWFADKIAALRQTSLSDTKIGDGLREALSVGASNAVKLASQNGGYAENPAIRIPFPEKLAVMEAGLRKIGMGKKVDDFELSMNRAAEKAAPLAKEIFLDAVMKLSFDDAEKILKGPDNSATEYLRASTGDRLREMFLPKIQESMNQYAVSQKYNQLVGLYQKVPLAKKPQMASAEDYVTEQALQGLYYLLAEQEKKIRTDPKARVTDLLQKVFSQAAAQEKGI